MRGNPIAQTGILVTLLLSACGGGSGGGDAGIVNPITGPLTSINQKIVFATQRAEICSDCAEGTSIQGISDEYRFEIDPVAGTVTMIDQDWRTTFDLEFLTEDAIYRSATIGESALKDTLTVLLPGAESGFYWNSYGVFAQPSGICLFSCVYWFDGDAFSFGVLTETGDMPVSGTGSYTGVMSGFYSRSTEQAQNISGDVSLTADFGSLQIAGTIENIQSSAVLGSTYDLADISLSATISGNQFSGSATGSVSGGVLPGGALGGEVSGSFYGPAAIEAGGVFEMSGAGNLIGAFAVKQ